MSKFEYGLVNDLDNCLQDVLKCNNTKGLLNLKIDRF